MLASHTSVRFLAAVFFTILLVNTFNFTYLMLKTSMRRPTTLLSKLNHRYWKYNHIQPEVLVTSTQEIDSTHQRALDAANFRNRTLANYTLVNQRVNLQPELEYEEECPNIPPDVGPLIGDSFLMTSFPKAFSKIKTGGIFTTEECKASQVVTIIVPFRERDVKVLNPFIKFIHPFLMRQQIDYALYLVEYENKSLPFSRGQLFNVGFLEAQSNHVSSCFVFHEPYVLPQDSRNLYRCLWYPRQLVTNLDGTNKSLYEFGKAVAMSDDSTWRVNGFSNLAGPGDDFRDLYNRIHKMNYIVERSDPDIGKYKNLKLNGSNEIESSPIPRIPITTSDPFEDGLSNLSYEKTLHKKSFYTLIKVSTRIAEQYDYIDRNGTE